MSSRRSTLKLRNRQIPQKKLLKSLEKEKRNKHKQQNITQELHSENIQIKKNVGLEIGESPFSKLSSHLENGDESGCSYVKEPRIKEREERKHKRKRKKDRKLEEREQKELERQQEEREREREKLEREELERQQDEREEEEREREECEREECEREEREREEREREEREREEREREEREREEREREEREREEREREEREREEREREEREREEREREEREREEREREERERRHDRIDERESFVADPLAFKTLKRKIKVLENNETLMHKKINCVAKDVHEIKNVLKCENRSNAPFDEDSYFAILPKFPLKKIKRVNAMETSVNESYEYKKRLLCKLCTIGGSNVKKNVINIFKRMFSPKLKTKFCWNGTVRGKVEFKNYEGILDVIRQAVRCTEAELEDECKLRFNQAQKDYDREKQKNAQRF